MTFSLPALVLLHCPVPDGAFCMTEPPDSLILLTVIQPKESCVNGFHRVLIMGLLVGYKGSIHPIRLLINGSKVNK